MYTSKPMLYTHSPLVNLHQLLELNPFRTFPQNPVPPLTPKREQMITGNCIMEDAKMTGITPAVLIFSGILLEFPPTSFLPCTFFAYCTGILRTPSFKTITRTTIRIIMAIMIMAATTPIAISLPNTN